MKRRDFIKTALIGAAGLALPLPWLERFAHAQTGAGRRLLIVMTPQGLNQRAWAPSAQGTMAALPTTLSSLERHRSRLLILSGIDNAVNSQFAVGGGGHNPAGRTLFTATPYAALMNTDGTMARTSSSQEITGAPWGPSIDQVIAGQIGSTTRFRSLHLRVGGAEVGEYEMFFGGTNGNVAAVGGEHRPDRVLANLTAAAPTTPTNPGQTAPPPTDLAGRLRARRASVLDAVGDQYSALAASSSAADRQRLEAHAEFVRDLERRLAPVSSGGGTGGTTAACSPHTFTPPSGYSPSNTFDHITAPAMMDNAVLALSCDLTRVVTVQFTDYHGPLFPFLGQTIPAAGAANWHEQIHNNRADDAATRAVVFDWYAQQVAHLLDRLAATPDGAGTLLDNTLVLWMSEFGNAASHDTSNLPVILAGSLPRVTMGRHLAMGGRTTNDLFTTIAQSFGSTSSTFGLRAGASGTMLSRGPLSL